MSEKRRGEIIKQTPRRPDAQTRRIQIPRKISFTPGALTPSPSPNFGRGEQIMTKKMGLVPPPCRGTFLRAKLLKRGNAHIQKAK
ncbi:MAG: hypothetical protein F6K58_22050 [Symploca sp. SIO2E9]|nr:hypothetical protein [Symploca sp. SIO2E9]